MLDAEGVPDTIGGYPYVEWLSTRARLAYADYWNSEEEEKKKPYWIADGDFDALERYVRRSGHLRQLEAALSTSRRAMGKELRGVGCDLGAGVLWAEPHLLRLGAVDRIYCVEYSEHRLTKLGPLILSHYGVPPDKVVLTLGDIHCLQLNDDTLDFAFMCASFHHANDPDQLLEELRRVLHPRGFVLIVGEHDRDLRLRHYLIGPARWALAKLPDALQRRLVGRVMHSRRMFPNQASLLVPDNQLGDHYYTREQYAQLFANAGFHHQCLRDRWSKELAFVLTPR